MQITADDVRWECPCSYKGKYMQVHMHRVNSKQPECKSGPMKMILPSSATLPDREEEEEEEEKEELEEEAGSSWETEGSEEEASPVATSEEVPVAPARASGPSATIRESPQPSRPALRILEVEPTASAMRIRITVENLSLFDLDRGDGYTGSLEDWVNEVIEFHFKECQHIVLTGVQAQS